MMRQRGYSIVEITIVLVVILMMSSFLATTYFQSEQDRRNEQAKRQMELIKKAVVDYAATNKTAVRYVEAINTRSGITVTHRWTLPAGRPYLPCPDIDGDGREDRVPSLPPSSVITISIALSVAVADFPLEENGGCYSSRGILPWLTLGTPPADPWGRRHTFRSAGIFSNAMTGFDQHTRANSVYKSRPLFVSGGVVGTQTFARIDFTETTLPAGSPLNITPRQYPAPALICGVHGACLDDSSPVANVSLLVAGVIPPSTGAVLADSTFADFDGALVVSLSLSGVVSGIPFVAVSHGKKRIRRRARRPGSGGICLRTFSGGRCTRRTGCGAAKRI